MKFEYFYHGEHGWGWYLWIKEDRHWWKVEVPPVPPTPPGGWDDPATQESLSFDYNADDQAWKPIRTDCYC